MCVWGSFSWGICQRYNQLLPSSKWLPAESPVPSQWLGDKSSQFRGGVWEAHRSSEATSFGAAFFSVVWQMRLLHPPASIVHLSVGFKFKWERWVFLWISLSSMCLLGCCLTFWEISLAFSSKFFLVLFLSVFQSIHSYCLWMLLLSSWVSVSRLSRLFKYPLLIPDLLIFFLMGSIFPPIFGFFFPYCWTCSNIW